MDSQEFKRVLSLSIVELQNLLKHDLTGLTIDPKWSAIDDVSQHIQFLQSQLEELSNFVRDKKN